MVLWISSTVWTNTSICRVPNSLHEDHSHAFSSGPFLFSHSSEILSWNQSVGDPQNTYSYLFPLSPPLSPEDCQDMRSPWKNLRPMPERPQVPESMEHRTQRADSGSRQWNSQERSTAAQSLVDPINPWAASQPNRVGGVSFPVLSNGDSNSWNLSAPRLNQPFFVPGSSTSDLMENQVNEFIDFSPLTDDVTQPDYSRNSSFSAGQPLLRSSPGFDDVEWPSPQCSMAEVAPLDAVFLSPLPQVSQEQNLVPQYSFPSSVSSFPLQPGSVVNVLPPERAPKVYRPVAPKQLRPQVQLAPAPDNTLVNQGSNTHSMRKLQSSSDRRTSDRRVRMPVGSRVPDIQEDQVVEPFYAPPPLSTLHIALDPSRASSRGPQQILPTPSGHHEDRQRTSVSGWSTFQDQSPAWSMTNLTPAMDVDRSLEDAVSTTNTVVSRPGSDEAEVKYRSDALYQVGPNADGQYHCPKEGTETCAHKPTKLKCNYE
ncbi:hypothetical protein LTR66_006335 [Elasticomyces elasticus]|nr:hypothetical protein LTR50_007144 [Elasticomyces elasticus]KAK4992222.1 hypothetical protein LTR66_006335 [Elasticomyces elasticus]